MNQPVFTTPSPKTENDIRKELASEVRNLLKVRGTDFIQTGYGNGYIVALIDVLQLIEGTRK